METLSSGFLQFLQVSTYTQSVGFGRIICLKKSEMMDMKKQIFLGVLLLFLFGGLRSSEIRYDKDTTELNFTGGTVTDEQLQSIAQTCPNLETLYIDTAMGFTHLGVQYVLDKCTKLTDLFLRYCTIEFEKLNGNKFKKLKNLDFSYSTITDQGLENIIQNGSNLSYLGLDGTEIIGENVTWGNFNNLKDLGLNSSKITNKALKNISAACNKLESLDISYNLNITREGVQHVLKKCVNLIQLNLSGCKKIDFEKLDWSKFNELENLYLEETNITEPDLQYILLSCPQLNVLYLTDCKNLRKEWQRIFDNKEDIQKLREQFFSRFFSDLARVLFTLILGFFLDLLVIFLGWYVCSKCWFWVHNLFEKKLR